MNDLGLVHVTDHACKLIFPGANFQKLLRIQENDLELGQVVLQSDSATITLMDIDHYNS